MSDVESSTTKGTGYQAASTFLFVPKSFGSTSDLTDDENRPGAYFRLGGVSEFETTNATASDVVASFYPRKHAADAGADKAVQQGAGASSGLQGIMLACNGRLLLRSGEKTYLHSTGSIDIDSEDFIRINAQKNLDINVKKMVTIVSGDTMTMNAPKKYETINGDQYELTDKNKYTVMKADTYSRTYGDTYKTTHGEVIDMSMGDAVSMWLGTKTTLSFSLDFTFAFATAITFYGVKIEFGVFKSDIVKFKLEYKTGAFTLTNFGVEMLPGAKAKAATAKAETTRVKAIQDDINANVKVITALLQTVNASNDQIDAQIATLKVIT